MANANTVNSYQGGTKRNQIPVLSGIGTTETAFSLNTDTGTAVAALTVPASTGVVGAQTPFDPSANPAITQASGRQYGPILGSDRPYAPILDGGLPFTIRVAGTYTSGVAANSITIGLYLGTSATLGSDHVITKALTSGAAAFGVLSGNFLLEVTCVWDSTSGYVTSFVSSAIIGAAGTASIYVSPVAGTEVAAAAVANLSFIPSATWGVSNAGNLVQINEFSISQN
jgi:hypothetical protein